MGDGPAVLKGFVEELYSVYRSKPTTRSWVRPILYLVHGKPLLCQIKCIIWCRKRVAIDPSHYLFEIQRFSKWVTKYLDFGRRWRSLNLAGPPIGSGNADVTFEGWKAARAVVQYIEGLHIVICHVNTWDYACPKSAMRTVFLYRKFSLLCI